MKINNINSLSVLAEGGEGIIYDYSPTEVIKVYKSHIDIASKERKVSKLLSKKLPPSVISPIDIVVNKNNKFIGYKMSRIFGEDFKKLSNKKYITSNKINTKDILEMLIKIKDDLDLLHSQDIYIGDLNDQNILFDLNYNIYFIDCDSWTIGNEACTVAMDLFKDPQLNSNNFNAETDTYSFAILAWKSLTRIHPFAGTMNPDIDILERMIKGISIIDNPKVKIPRTVNSWKNLSPNLIDNFKSIFENKTRSFGNEFEDLQQNFILCNNHHDYYYSKYNSCPICDTAAKVLIKPISQGVMSGLSIVPLLKEDTINIILDLYTYIDKSGNIVNRKLNKSTKFISGRRYYFTKDSEIVDYIHKFEIITSMKTYTIDKKFRSNLIIDNDILYYIDKKGSLIKSTIMKQGNSMQKIADCANSAYFDVNDGHYCIINEYDDKLIINIDGYNNILDYINGIINYGIHYDNKLDRWLIVLEDKFSQFRTLVMYTKGVSFDDTRIKYKCHLNNLCLSNSTIFIPIDGAIRGYAYNKDVFKDFECNVVSPDSKLLRNGKSFTIINDENIYTFG